MASPSRETSARAIEDGGCQMLLRHPGHGRSIGQRHPYLVDAFLPGPRPILPDEHEDCDYADRE
jgi:hypothetical protein